MERERRSTGLAFQLTTLAYRSYAYDMERERRFELPTLALARRCSTTELFPLNTPSHYKDNFVSVKRLWQFLVTASESIPARPP